MRLTLRAALVTLLLLAVMVADKGVGVLRPAVLWAIAFLDWWLAGRLLGWALARVIPRNSEPQFLRSVLSGLVTGEFES